MALLFNSLLCIVNVIHISSSRYKCCDVCALVPELIKIFAIVRKVANSDKKQWFDY